MNKIVISKQHNPYFNLALEEELLYEVEEGQVIFYLWQNDRTIVIGRNQNPWIECDVEAAKQEKVKIARRLSGGGAVYHDLGNLNFTFITKIEQQNLQKQLQVMIQALETFSLEVTCSGRNDLLVQDKKFSGHAFYEEDGRYFHHGTLMVDVDHKMLGKVLTPTKLKMKTKSITSVKSRVVNLNQIKASLTIENLKEQLIKQFEKIYGQAEVISRDREDLPEKLGVYQSDAWILGESPSFNVVVEKRIEAIGNIQVAMKVVDGIIKEVKLYSDTLKIIDFSKIEEKLIDISFSKEYVEDLLVNALELTI